MATSAEALVVGGGGVARTDCLAVFDAPVNIPAKRPRHITCADGDACDADGAVNGSCRFPVAVCVNSTFDPRCSLGGVQSVVVDHALDNGDPRFDPEFQALQTRIDSLDLPTAESVCTTPTNLTLVVEGPFSHGLCRRTSKLVRMTTESQEIVGDYFDRDRIRLTCLAAAAGCDPQVLFTGTFDRIQKQIFDQSCAKSGCHDSQSQAAGLLLETGAAYGNLINVTPTNAAAAAAGWKRVTMVDVDTGDLATSLLFHKVNGTLPAGFGERMPFGEPPIAQNLIDIIQLWIEAGAPETGWVPGTD